jgi:hypothetical protein
MTEWMTLVKHEMKKGLSLKDAMKEAKKHYHPSKKTQKGGVLVKVGGKRRVTRRKQRGGQLYGFGEGGGSLADGNGRITPVGSVADAANKIYGGRRHSRRRHH